MPGGIFIAQFTNKKLADKFIEQQTLFAVIETTSKDGKVRYTLRQISAATPLNAPKETSKGTEKTLAFFRSRQSASKYEKALEKKLEEKAAPQASGDEVQAKTK